ncbi:hypothetical protein V1478_009515 [Vespula squamosa]|uniref:Uncharacterized protein n=1 Tax=Vespula squamosa TaxID=30214 RepID=A0ABD2APV6_VESSQ
MSRRTKIPTEKVVTVINQFQRCVVFLNSVSWRKYGGLVLVDSSPSLMEYETWTPLRLTNGAHEEKVSKAGSEVGHDFDRSQGPYSRGMAARKACHFVGAALVFALARTFDLKGKEDNKEDTFKKIKEGCLCIYKINFQTRFTYVSNGLTNKLE